MATKNERNEALSEKQYYSDQKFGIDLSKQRAETDEDIQRVKNNAQKNSIKNQIANKEREIADLVQKISEFEAMKAKIAQAIASLNAAKINISYAANKIQISFVTLSSNQWINNCYEENGQIDSLISNLNSTLPEIEKEVHSINVEITDKENQVVLLYRKLNSL